jgi:hypothetical protein
MKDKKPRRRSCRTLPPWTSEKRKRDSSSHFLVARGRNAGEREIQIGGGTRIRVLPTEGKMSSVVLLDVDNIV